MGRRFDLEGWTQLSLERFVQNPPDVLIAGFFDQPSTTSSHWSLSRHARVKDMMDSLPTISIPSKYLACNGLFSVDAAELIRTEAIELELLPGGNAS